MTTPRSERIERLPGWARRYIEGLEHRIDEACFDRWIDEPKTRSEARQARAREAIEDQRHGGQR